MSVFINVNKFALTRCSYCSTTEFLSLSRIILFLDCNDTHEIGVWNKPGSVVSQNHPFNYPNNANSCWMLRNGAEFTQLTMFYFDTEPGADFVTVRVCSLNLVDHVLFTKYMF